MAKSATKQGSESYFSFDRYELDKAAKQIKLYYSLSSSGEVVSFREVYLLPKKLKWTNTSSAALQNAVKLLHILAGVSYWKARCFKDIRFSTYDLNKEESSFFEKVYENGLGEFFYNNKINFKKLIKFPSLSAAQKSVSHGVKVTNKSLLLFGGGKDSLVSAELLAAAQKKFSFLYVATGSHANIMKGLLPKDAIVIDRKIDPKLFELNKQPKVYNGHVPISAIIAAVAEIAAILYGYKYVIASNERSSNYGNVKYLGKLINHQWSKSLEFDKLFSKYTSSYVTPSVEYFSLLRPIYEVKILEIFSRFPKYFKKFSSCNRNFRINNGRLEKGNLWCGECPKCAFVFTMLSAFMPKAELVSIFGKDMFNDKALIALYEELLGLKNFKPFECVGTPEEMILALFMAYRNGEYKDSSVMNLFSHTVLKRNHNILEIQKKLSKVYSDHLIPKEFGAVLKLLK